jgi:SAM-dependent methyltransferase
LSGPAESGYGLAPQRDPAEIARKRALRAGRGLDFYRAAVEKARTVLCPVCGYEGPFSPVREKPGLWCPACDSRPRHRLLKLWMDRELVIAPGTRMLHFAPEAPLGALLRPRLAEYVTADLEAPADLPLDITAIALPAARYDLIMVNHVLEHVDDRAALRELNRILTPGGRLILTVPLVEGWEETYEDPAIATPEGRLRAYTDALHLRLYGRDFPDRVAAFGFRVAAFAAVEPDVSRHALQRGEKVFVATKIAEAAA